MAAKATASRKRGMTLWAGLKRRTGTTRHVRFGSIALKKSVSAVDRIFSALPMHFLNKDAEGHMAERQRDVGGSKWNSEANESRM
jgi:hypothetical protein